MGSFNVGVVFAMFSAMIALSSVAGVHLHISNEYMLTYEVSANGILDLQIEVSGLGWVGVGVNNKESMDGADLFIGGFASGAGYEGDYHVPEGAGNTAPTRDDLKNWDLVSASEKNENTTSLHVTRPLISPDKNQDIDIEDKEMYLLWSFNKDSDSTTARHTTRGSCKINLVKGESGNCNMSNGDSGASSIATVGMSTLLMAVVAAVLKN